MFMDQTEFYKKEVLFILSNYLDINNVEIDKVRLVFTKVYSVRLAEKISRIIDKKCFWLLRFYHGDSIEYINEKTSEVYFVDKLSLYTFEMEGSKYYLLFSIVYEKENLGLKVEKVHSLSKS